MPDGPTSTPHVLTAQASFVSLWPPTTTTSPLSSTVCPEQNTASDVLTGTSCHVAVSMRAGEGTGCAGRRPEEKQE